VSLTDLATRLGFSSADDTNACPSNDPDNGKLSLSLAVHFIPLF